MRRAAKIDANQPEIVGALKACGARVESLAAVGGGVPDLLVAHRGRLLLLEVKDGSKPPSARQLTADQQDWHDRWRGPYLMVVQDVESAIAALSSKEQP